MQTWVLNEVGLHQVVEDMVLTDPLHRAAAGRAKRRALHPACVAGSTEGVHTGLQAKGKIITHTPLTFSRHAKHLTRPQSRAPL